MDLQFHIEIDHKPLVPLLSTKHLEELPIRIQCFKMCLIYFLFIVSHVPDKLLITSDTLSRASLADFHTIKKTCIRQSLNMYVRFSALFQQQTPISKEYKNVRKRMKNARNLYIIRKLYSAYLNPIIKSPHNCQ